LPECSVKAMLDASGVPSRRAKTTPTICPTFDAITKLRFTGGRSVD
jgi:hypothetical protein